MAFTIAISKERTHLKNNIWQKTFIVFFLVNWINSYVGNTDTANWILENTLVYTKSFGKHNINALAGTTALDLSFR